MTADAPKLLRIGEVAEAAGTTPRTIRYYEEIGLLPAARGREPGSHRLYEAGDVERLQELLSLKSLLGISTLSGVMVNALITIPAVITPVIWGLAQGLQRFALISFTVLLIVVLSSLYGVASH